MSTSAIQYEVPSVVVRSPNVIPFTGRHYQEDMTNMTEEDPRRLINVIPSNLSPEAQVILVAIEGELRLLRQIVESKTAELASVVKQTEAATVVSDTHLQEQIHELRAQGVARDLRIEANRRLIVTSVISPIVVAVVVAIILASLHLT